MNTAGATFGLSLLAVLPLGGLRVWAAPAAPAADITLYQVKPGDSLGRLAALYMNGKADAVLVQRLNGLPDPRRMPVGFALRIPTRLLKSEPVTLTVTSITGTVTRAGPGLPLAPLARGEALREGERVSTGANAFATLTQADGTRVALPSNTTLRIGILRRVLLDGAANSSLVIESGRGEMRVTPLRKPTDRFEIRTPAAVAAVRGTEFRVAYEPTKSVSTLEVTEGRVAEAPSTGGDPALIPAGQAAQRPLGGERRIIPLPAAPELAPAPAREPAPGITLMVADAKAGFIYNFLFARDLTFTEVLEAVTSATGVAHVDPDPGPLAVRITAVDQNGVEGFAKDYTILRPTEPGAPAKAT